MVIKKFSDSGTSKKKKPKSESQSDAQLETKSNHQQSLLTPKLTKEDAKNASNIRPDRFDDYIGQKQLKKVLKIA